jgi:hypothetical protein
LHSHKRWQTCAAGSETRWKELDECRRLPARFPLLDFKLIDYLEQTAAEYCAQWHSALMVSGVIGRLMVLKHHR